jgi:hypothetical protein
VGRVGRIVTRSIARLTAVVCEPSKISVKVVQAPPHPKKFPVMTASDTLSSARLFEDVPPFSVSRFLVIVMPETY